MVTQTPDFIFTGKYVLPDNRQQSAIKNGGIAVQNDTIVAVGEQHDLLERFPKTDRFHEEHGLIMPGLINTHTHAAMSCLRGLADDLPLMEWLEKHIFPIEAELTGEMIYQSTLLSIAEMIKSGTTSFCDMYLFAKDVARAASESGIRSWIGEVLYDFPSPNYGEVENGLSYIKDLFDHYKTSSLVTITVDPHSVYTCSPALLSRLGTVASDHDCLYVIHLSENESEVNSCLERYGKSPVEHLEDLGLLSPATLASHCVMLSSTDIDIMSKRDVKVAHCIESNMKLASGIAPVVRMLDKGITLAIGTDGSASNNDVDMFSELNSIAKLHKVENMDPTVMTAEQTLKAATLGGAKALGVDAKIGSLETGKKADFIVLNLDQPHMTPMYNIPSHLTYVARGGDVIHSFVGGKQLMKNRELLTLDEDKLLRTMRNISDNIIKIGC